MNKETAEAKARVFLESIFGPGDARFAQKHEELVAMLMDGEVIAVEAVVVEQPRQEPVAVKAVVEQPKPAPAPPPRRPTAQPAKKKK